MCTSSAPALRTKSSLIEVPLTGGHLKRGGHISVPRDDPRGSIKTIQVAAQVI